jgi:integrase
MEKLTDRGISKLSPTGKQRIVFDSEVPGFGVRITPAGVKAFVLDYRIGGRQRRYTIGRCDDWAVEKARRRARELRREVDLDRDPQQERDDIRAEPTVADLCDQFERELLPKRRDSTAASYRSLIGQLIRPHLGKGKVSALTHRDVDAFHRGIAEATPYRANRALAVLSRIISKLAIPEHRADNPCRGIERAGEEKRVRYASADEIRRLSEALTRSTFPDMANAVRLLLLTGARRGELLRATWAQFDLQRGTWSKPAAATKQRRVHVVPLSAPARQLLSTMQKEATTPELFPGDPEWRLRKCWSAACAEAHINDLRVHDLRHAFASILASSGASLPLIGSLLGHSTPVTTARYAHLLDDPLRAAADRVGAFIEAASEGKQAKVAKLRRRGE